MGIFFTSSRPVVPAINESLRDALMLNPSELLDIDAEASKRAVKLTDATTPQFNAWRFGAAVTIAGALLWGAIWTSRHNLPDISKSLMDSFSGFSGLVLGLLGGEAQKSP